MSSEVDILRYRNSELEVALRRLTAEMDARQCRQCADLEGRLSKACDTLVNYQAGYRDQCEKLAEARAEIERLRAGVTSIQDTARMMAKDAGNAAGLICEDNREASRYCRMYQDRFEELRTECELLDQD